MKSLLQIFKPDPYLPVIEDKTEVNRMYHYWRIRILYSMFIGYALYYFTRKSFTFAAPGLIDELGLTKQQMGLLGSVFSLSYGFSKFLSGILSDRSNPRYFMAVGLFVTGILNILFGYNSSLIMFVIFWGLNGWFQGFGWPPCARFLTHWYSHSERGSWWSTWNISHNLGAFLIPWIVGFALEYYGWRFAMYIPGLICIAGSFFLVNRLRDTPQSLGLPPIETFRNDYSGTTKEEVENEHELSTKEILFEHILKNPYMWVLAASYFFVYLVRTGVNDWSTLFLIEEKDYSLMGATGSVSLFEIGGLLGSLAAGWSSDYLFGARRGPVNAIFAIGIALSIFLFWFAPVNYPILDSLAIFLLGFTIFGPQMLIGVAAAELSHKKAAATATGFIGWLAYIGAAVAGYPLGSITQNYGWSGFFIALSTCALLSVALLIPLWRIDDKKSHKLRPKKAEPALQSKQT